MNEQELWLQDVWAVRYRMPLQRAYGTARGRTVAATNFLVLVGGHTSTYAFEGVGESQPRHVLTGDGDTGRKEAWRFACAATDAVRGGVLRIEDPSVAVEEVRRVIAELGVVAEGFASESNADRPFRGTLLGFEVALLDVVAQVFGLRISELLGERRQDIHVSISTISSATSASELAAKVRRQARFPMTRIKGLGEPTSDLELLRTVARANTDENREKPLWIDINESMDFANAEVFVEAVADGIASGVLPSTVTIEGMLPKRDFLELPRLQRLADERMAAQTAGQEVSIRIMPDEGLWDASDLRALEDRGGCSAINMKTPKAGGLLPTLDLAHAAVAANPNIKISLGGMVGTSDITAWALHNLARALPRVDYLTAVPPGNVKARIATPVTRFAGRGTSRIRSQTKPGLGATLDYDALQPYIEESYPYNDRPQPHVYAPLGRSAAELDSPNNRRSRGSTTIAFLGDFSMGDAYINRTGGELLERLDNDPTQFLEGLAHLVSGADHVIVNFESVLAVEPRGPLDGRKRYLGWDTPQRTIDCLRYLGTSAVSLANNHTMDFGSSVLLETIQYFRSAGIATFGAGETLAEAAAPYELTFGQDGQSYSVFVTGALAVQRALRDDYGFYAESNRAGTNPLSSSTAEQIEHIRAGNPDALIIAFPHWGRNYQWVGPRAKQKAGELLRAGSNIIIGHGAHMLQECVSDGETAVAYSLGNSLFNWGGRFKEHSAPPFGFVARVTLDLESDDPVDTRLYPIFIDNRRSNHRPRPVTSTEMDSLVLRLLEHDDGSLGTTVSRSRDDFGEYLKLDVAPMGEPPWAQRARKTAQPVVVQGYNTYPDGAARAFRKATDKQLLGTSLIVHEARRSGAGVTWLAQDTAIAETADKRHLLKGNRSRESLGASRLVSDKAAVKSLLEDSGVPTPRGGVARSAAEAVDLLEKIGGPVAIKPQRGDRGRGITVGASTSDAVREAYRSAESGTGVIVEEVVYGEEYRCLATGSQCLGVMRKEPPNVIGNGSSSIAQLITKKNVLRSSNPHLYTRLITIDQRLREFLFAQELTLWSVPRSGEKIFLSSFASFTLGADPHAMDLETVPHTVIEAAVMAVDSIPGLPVAGLDILYGPLSTKEELGPKVAVLEVNTNAAIGGFHFPLTGTPKNVASTIWDTRAAPARALSAPGQLSQRGTWSAPEAVERRPEETLAVSKEEAGGGENLVDAVHAELRRRGALIRQLTASVNEITMDGEHGLLTGLALDCDPTALFQVIARPRQVRRLLRMQGIPAARLRRVKSGEDVVGTLEGWGRRGGRLVPARVLGSPRAFTVFPPDVPLSAAKKEMGSFKSRAVLLREHIPGARIHVMASGSRALASFSDDAPEPSQVDAAEKLACQAVGAIPELRWALISVVLASDRPADPLRPIFESMTVQPAFDEAWRRVSGSMEACVAEVLRPLDTSA